MRDLVETAIELAGRGTDAALALVADTEGTCYRGRGAMALFDAQGARAGSLSPSFHDPRIEDAARRVLAQGHAQDLRLDLHERERAPAATDAQPLMHLLVLPIPAHASPLREAMASACSASAWLRVRINPGADDANRSGLGSGEARTGSAVFTFDRSGLACPGPLAFQRYISLALAPPPRILLAGVAAETPAFAQIARLLGWYVELVEHRSEFTAYREIGQIDQHHLLPPDALQALLSARHYDAAIVGSHDFATDASYLRHLAGAGIGYIGLLGSPERRDALLAQLGDIIATQLEPRLYAPAGLRLGGEGPESVALAVVAQLQHYLAHDAHA